MGIFLAWEIAMVERSKVGDVALSIVFYGLRRYFYLVGVGKDKDVAIREVVKGMVGMAKYYGVSLEDVAEQINLVKLALKDFLPELKRRYINATFGWPQLE